MVKLEIISENASRVTMASGAATGLAGLALNEVIAVCGLVFTAATFFVNLYYKIKMAQIAEASLNQKETTNEPA